MDGYVPTHLRKGRLWEAKSCSCLLWHNSNPWNLKPVTFHVEVSFTVVRDLRLWIPLVFPKIKDKGKMQGVGRGLGEVSAEA